MVSDVVIDLKIDLIVGEESVDWATFGVVAVAAEHCAGGCGGLRVEEVEEVLGSGIFKRFDHFSHFIGNTHRPARCHALVACGSSAPGD